MVTPADRLQLLYDLAREVATFTDLDSVLRYATRRTREVLGAEGCSVLLLDGTRRTLYFPVASQAESGAASDASLEQVSFPADKGIAGWVLQHDQATQVDDVASDPRFYSAVDRQVGSRTRALLCAPLRTRSGNIGVVEVVNPLRGRFTADDRAAQAMAADTRSRARRDGSTTCCAAKPSRFARHAWPPGSSCSCSRPCSWPAAPTSTWLAPCRSANYRGARRC
jgi:GAF domain-containing protein